MNRKLFKTIILSTPVILGCVTACATSSSCSCSSNSDIPNPRPTQYNPLPYKGTDNVFNVDSDGQCLGFIDGFDKNDPKYQSYDTMYIPNTIKSFKNNVFQNMIPSSIKNIIFEDNSEVTTIPTCAFYNDAHIPLKYVEIPEKVASVEYYSFWMDAGNPTIYFKNPIGCTFGQAWGGWNFLDNSKLYFKKFIQLPTWKVHESIYMYGSAHVYTMGLNSEQIEKFKNWFKEVFPVKDGQDFNDIKWN